LTNKTREFHSARQASKADSQTKSTAQVRSRDVLPSSNAQPSNTLRQPQAPLFPKAASRLPNFAPGFLPAHIMIRRKEETHSTLSLTYPPKTVLSLNPIFYKKAEFLTSASFYNFLK